MNTIPDLGQATLALENNKNTLHGAVDGFVPVANVADAPGISDLRELLLLVASLCNAIVKAKEDDKINLADLKYMLPVLKRLKPALQDVDNAWDALRGITDGQATLLSELFCLEVGVPVSEKTTVLIASALRISADLSTVIRHIGDIKSQAQAD